ncbi:MAG: ABC transporter transmembrane domain-containing protein, partial [Cellvibrionaceae bacterium]|nr:ABC transporter transmembrane domain-containing protein [Cellvibrionaceae bacterium]
AVASLAIGQGVRLIIDRGFGSGSIAELNTSVLFLAAITLVIAIGTFVRFYLVSWLGERVCADLRQRVFNHLLGLPPSYFETNRSGEIMSRLTTDTSLLETIIGSSLSMALRSSLTFSGGLIMLLITNIKLSLIVLISVPLLLGPILIYGRKVRALSRKSQDSIAGLGSYAGEAIEHIKTVQSYNREAYERDSFSSVVENTFAVARQRIRQRALLIAVVITLVFGAITGMLWVGGYDVLNGNMSGGDLGAFVFYAIMVAMAVATLSEVFGDLQRAAGATERLLELMAVNPSIAAPAQPQTIPADVAELRFNEVDFSYPSRPEQKALDNFTLHIHPGESVALVGPSGAGKSTVFELVQRFYDPAAGAIYLGEAELPSLAPQQLREHMALVPQQPALFTADVLHNIRYGKLDASEDEVIAAAVAAHAHEFISALPQGYHTQLGEKGAQLSGGQRQRIAIARAILNDPKILLLDEATSALDAESEYHVQQALNELMKNRTTLIIAHRLATIIHADKIAVMDQGKIVASGTHQDLLQSSSLYQRLASLQFNDAK